MLNCRKINNIICRVLLHGVCVKMQSYDFYRLLQDLSIVFEGGTVGTTLEVGAMRFQGTLLSCISAVFKKKVEMSTFTGGSL